MKTVLNTFKSEEITAEGVIGLRRLLNAICRTVIRNIVQAWL
jgi:hypothetical protein